MLYLLKNELKIKQVKIKKVNEKKLHAKRESLLKFAELLKRRKIEDAITPEVKEEIVSIIRK